MSAFYLSISETRFQYRRPVVCICDRHCFSATEITLSGLQSLPQVKVLGEPTLGGTGRREKLLLPRSGMHVELVTEKVFLTHDGRAIDGVGVQPDTRVDLDVETIAGDRDTMLERAVAELDAPHHNRGNQ